ncbi:MAG: cupin domain-containing protein [Candidatus Zipacnadales bacterium]
MATRAQALVRHVDEVDTVVHSVCGKSVRLFTYRDDTAANLHVTTIHDAALHYHEHCTEYYYVLNGSGSMQLGEETIKVRPGTAILIPPGVPHCGRGGFTAIVFGVPAWDEVDEVLVPQ